MNSEEYPVKKPDLIPGEDKDLPESSVEDLWESDRPDVRSISPKSKTSDASEVALVEQLIEEIEQESVAPDSINPTQPKVEEITQQVSQLEQQKQTLEAEIRELQIQKERMLSEQIAEIQETLGRMVREGIKELESRKQALEVSIEQLERRRDRIREEMRTSFAGVSQELAIRVQGFKDYLVGSLQDLAATAEQLELPAFEKWEKPKESNRESIREKSRPEPASVAPKPQFIQQRYQDQAKEIQRILDQYRTRPDYYGPPWQLRRTFEPIHAERVQNWFFSQGGRGTIRTMGSRLQNILIASAVMSVLHKIYGDRTRTLVLANTPERLGEWRRGLQDCLGISRSDFGPERGVTLFESPEALIQKADRLVENKQLPLVIIDETENEVNLSLLQFPLWLAFASAPQQMSSYTY
jgi:outer membrane murein-binding lipoprotein Lpp